MRRSRLVLGVLAALMAAGVVASAWWVIGEARRSIVEQVEHREVLAADERAASLGETLRIARERVEIMASAPGLTRWVLDGDALFVQRVLDYYRAQPGVTALEMRAADGSVIAASGRVIGTTDYRATRDRTAAYVTLEGTSRATDGRVIGVLRTELSITKINGQLLQPYRDFDGTTSIVTRDGRVLLSTSTDSMNRVRNAGLLKLLSAGRSGTVTRSGRIMVVSPVSGTELRIIVAADTSEATTPATRLGARLGIAFLVTLTVVGALGLLAAIVLRRSRRELEEARRLTDELARTDPLTGLANRRAFDGAVEHVRDTGRHAAVVLIDLDHLKAINDTCGHAAGDDALRRTADAIRSVVRPTDLVARLGGDELVIVLPETSTWRAHAVADDVRAAIGAIIIDGFGALSACTGVDAAHGDLAAALERADRSLYEAKRGREPAT